MNGGGENLQVLVVADDALARAGLVAMVSVASGLAVVGQLPAHELGQNETPRADAILWDLGSQNGGIDFAVAAAPILALVGDPSRASEVLAAGARGVLLRQTSTAVLEAALTAVARDLVVLDPQIAAALAPAPRSHVEPQSEPLTPREIEVLQLLARGWTNKEIARALGISEHTAKFHVTSILANLGAEGRTEAVVRAARLGLVVL